MASVVADRSHHERERVHGFHLRSCVAGSEDQIAADRHVHCMMEVVIRNLCSKRIQRQRSVNHKVRVYACVHTMLTQRNDVCVRRLRLCRRRPGRCSSACAARLDQPIAPMSQRPTQSTSGAKPLSHPIVTVIG
jgi:hypothetical protein